MKKEESILKKFHSGLIPLSLDKRLTGGGINFETLEKLLQFLEDNGIEYVEYNDYYYQSYSNQSMVGYVTPLKNRQEEIVVIYDFIEVANNQLILMLNGQIVAVFPTDDYIFMSLETDKNNR